MADFNRSTNSNGSLTITDYNGSVSKTTGTSYRFVNSRAGATTPDYVKKAKLGQLPMLPFTYRKFTQIGGIGGRVISSSSPGPIGDYRQEGDWMTGGLGILNTKASADRHNQSTLDALDGVASTNALNKIKAQKVNILQDLAEGRQTISLLTTTVGRLTNAFRFFKRGNLGAAVTSLGATRPSRKFRKKYNSLKGVGTGGNSGVSVFSAGNLASLWLELQYGWRPLVGSISGAVELYNQQLVQGKIIKVVRSTRNVEDKILNTTSIFPPGFYSANHTNVSSHDYKVKYTIYYRIQDTGDVTLAQAGLTNPPNLLWEIVPFSFVVDWLFNIGDYLSSLDATSGLAFEKGCITRTYKLEATKTTTWGTTLSYQTVSGSVVSTFRDFLLTREVLTEFPSPTRPYYTGAPKNVSNYISAVALLAVTVFGGKAHRSR